MNENLMLEAVALSRRASGRTAPNPCVGALLVKDGQILARGWHEQAGQPHAEVNCLRQAASLGINAAECTLLVTLEPCNHHGKTPPCTQAILEAGIRHLVIGTRDPTPKAAGGLEFLRAHGVQVDCGLAEQACRDNLADFLVWHNSRRPYVILKLASSLDGRIATRNGHSQWISGPQALGRVQELRAWAQAVLVGGNTFYQDNPRLDCRLPGYSGPQPLAVVVSSRLPEAPDKFHILQQRPGSAIFWTGAAEAAGAKAARLRDLGVTVWGLPPLSDRAGKDETGLGPDAGLGSNSWPDAGLGLDLQDGLDRLRSERGVYNLLCEGGGSLGLRLWEAGLADEFRLHLAPKILGDSAARPLFAGRAPLHMDEALRLRLTGSEMCGEDLLITFRRRDI